MHLILAAICEQASERADGKLDLHGVFNELAAPGFPAMQDHMTLVLVIEWEREESGEIEIRAELEHESGQKVLSIEGTTDVEQRPQERAAAQTRLVLPLERVVFPQEGAYTFVLHAGQTRFRAVPLFLSRSETTEE